ncbi:phosphatase PAP2 family protein [Streptomyces sp. NPDC004838]
MARGAALAPAAGSAPVPRTVPASAPAPAPAPAPEPRRGTSVRGKRGGAGPGGLPGPLVRTASPHSFPSSHATSAAAAAVAFGALTPAGRHLVPPLAAAVCVSRLVVGVHYPTDVAAGVALGALAARLGAGWARGVGKGAR